MTRRVYNFVVDESGKPIEGVEVHISLNRTTYNDTMLPSSSAVTCLTEFVFNRQPNICSS
jgi:hypothetical protein